MWETLLESWKSLLEPLHDPVTLAIPAFVIFLAIEWFAARALEDHPDDADGRARPAQGGYRSADARTQRSTRNSCRSQRAPSGKCWALIGYSAIWVYLAPWHLSPTAWYTWVILLLGIDVLYYAYHRIAHRVRVIWATHQAHHSSEYFNFSTALRQKWNNSGEIIMWLPLPFLGIPPWMVFVGFSVSLVYQFFVHTERVGKLWRPIEFIFNTPSHHRVHHGSDAEYLDRNYGRNPHHLGPDVRNLRSRNPPAHLRTHGRRSERTTSGSSKRANMLPLLVIGRRRHRGGSEPATCSARPAGRRKPRSLQQNPQPRRTEQEQSDR